MMMMKLIIKNIIIVGLFCASGFVQGMEKTIIEKHKEFLAEQKEPSNFMRWVNKIAGPYVLEDYPSKSTNLFHQELWKKAQNDLNIPERYHAPIVAFDLEKNNLNDAKSDNIVIHACMRDKMYINEEQNSIDNQLFRFNHYHEAAHHKYLDPFHLWKKALLLKISNAVLPPLVTFGLPYCSFLYAATKIKNPKISSILNKFPNSTLLAAVLTSCGIALPSSIFLSEYVIVPLSNKNLEKYSKFFERRADLETAYALKCNQCVQKKADSEKNGSQKDQELSTKNGYLSWEELEAIAQEHKQNGRVCDYHKKEIEAIAHEHKQNEVAITHDSRMRDYHGRCF
jgi:hypothetical protein